MSFFAKFRRCVGEKAFVLLGHQEAFKADKISLSSLSSSDAISSRDFFDQKSHCHIGNQSRLSSKNPLFLDQSEKSPDSGKATDE